MKIDIILITFNQELYIAQAVESVLMQRFDGEIEVVIADDCSTDNTLSIIRSYEEQSPFKFKYLENTLNLGISKNYQKAFSACDGNYIAILEGDDYWCNPFRLQRHIDFLEEHRECVLTMNSYISFYEQSKQYTINTPQFNSTFQYVTFQDMLKANMLGNLSSCVYRKSAIDKVKPDLYDIQIENVDDWLLGLVVSQYGLIALLKDAMTIYRVNEGGAWSKLTLNKRYESIFKRIQVYNSYFNDMYSKEFHSHYLRLKNEIKETRKQQTWPPLLIYLSLVGKMILSCLKKILLLFIPQNLKRKFKVSIAHIRNEKK